jgi:hypothetical protein
MLRGQPPPGSQLPPGCARCQAMPRQAGSLPPAANLQLAGSARGSARRRAALGAPAPASADGWQAPRCQQPLQPGHQFQQLGQRLRLALHQRQRLVQTLPLAVPQAAAAGACWEALQGAHPAKRSQLLPAQRQWERPLCWEWVAPQQQCWALWQCQCRLHLLFLPRSRVHCRQGSCEQQTQKGWYTQHFRGSAGLCAWLAGSCSPGPAPDAGCCST